MSSHLRQELQMVSAMNTGTSNDQITDSGKSTKALELAAHLHAKSSDLNNTTCDQSSLCGLTGIGDLIVTCASVHSRNRKAGYLMGQGKSMEEAMKEVNMVVEGVYSAKAAAKLAQKYEVPMPIVDEINKVLFEGKDPKQAVDDLMLRESKIENSSLLWEE